MTDVKKSSLAVCLAFVLKSEGGYSNDPGDPGGATMEGITHIDYDAYRKAKGLPLQDVRKIIATEVQDIYTNHYWIPSHAEGLPWPLALVQFDCAVNQGLGRANITINRVLGVNANSAIWLEATSVAAHALKDPKVATLDYINKRIEFYNALAAHRPQFQKFLKGWLNRMAALKVAAGV